MPQKWDLRTKKLPHDIQKAQGQVEGFTKLINKTAAIARAEGIDFHEATYDVSRDTAPCNRYSTIRAAYELLMNEEVRERDNQYKKKLKTYHNTRHRAKEHKVKVGEAVLLKHETKRKGETPFEPYVYVATKVTSSTIHARRVNDGKTVS